MKATKSLPWNHEGPVGEKTPFTLAETLCLIRIFQKQHNYHDLALFALGVDSMLRGGDLLQLRVRHVTDQSGNIINNSVWRQSKTNENVNLAITPTTIKALRDWISYSGKKPDDFLFTRTKEPIGSSPIGPGHYRVIVKTWARLIGLPDDEYSTHSIRRTKPSFLYSYGLSDIATIANMLGHTDTTATLRYLGIGKEQARRHALRGDIFNADPSSLKLLTPLARDFLNPAFLDEFTEETWRRLEVRLHAAFDDFVDGLLDRLAAGQADPPNKKSQINLTKHLKGVENSDTSTSD